MKTIIVSSQPTTNPIWRWMSTMLKGEPGSSIANPVDCSSREKFEFVLRNAPEGSVIQLLPGEYQLGPSGNNSPGARWAPRAWVIRGSGMHNTFIKLVGCEQAGRVCMFSDHYARDFDGFEMHDVTLDLDLHGQPAGKDLCVQGVSLSGSDILLRRVRVVGAGTTRKGLECFPIQIFAHGQTRQGDVTIDECVVTAPHRDHNADGMSAITIWPASKDASSDPSCQIRNCVVDFSGDPMATYSHAFGAPVVTGCSAFGVEKGFYSDYWDSEWLEVRDCHFDGGRFGVYIADVSGAWKHKHISIRGNHINRVSNAFYPGIWLSGSKDVRVFGRVIIEGNMLTGGGSGIDINSVRGLACIRNNITPSVQCGAVGSLVVACNVTEQGLNL